MSKCVNLDAFVQTFLHLEQVQSFTVTYSIAWEYVYSVLVKKCFLCHTALVLLYIY